MSGFSTLQQNFSSLHHKIRQMKIISLTFFILSSFEHDPPVPSLIIMQQWKPSRLKYLFKKKTYISHFIGKSEKIFPTFEQVERLRLEFFLYLSIVKIEQQQQQK